MTDRTEMLCACSRPVKDAFVCKECAATAADNLAHIADLAQHADEKRARYGSNWKTGTIGRAAETPLPYDPRVSRVLDPIRVSLHGTARIILEDCDEEDDGTSPIADSVSSVATWLVQFTDWLRRQAVGPEEFASIGAASKALFALFDRPPETVYVGTCGDQTEAGTCPESLYVDPDASAVRCSRCKAVHDVDVRRDQLADQVEEYLGTAREISALCRIQFGDDVSTAMIRGYVRHGLLQPKGERAVMTLTGLRKATVYRIGDVREIVSKMDDRERRRIKKQQRSEVA